VAADMITLRGKEVPLVIENVENTRLRFYTENPRIYSHLWRDEGREPTQQEIFEVLAKTEHVREVLLPSIRANGGLIEPLLVKGHVVLEGNSRLAAYRLLSDIDKERWRYVRVRKLPSDTSEADVFALLGEYHIVGKKDWQPFEQAGYLYRRHNKHGIREPDLEKEIGLSASKIKHLIRVYQFMLDHDDRNPSRWSYYDELLKGRKFADAITKYPDFNEIIVEKINSGEIERAVDVRDLLPLITKAGGNTLKRFISGAYSFEQAVSDARLRGAGDYNHKRLNEFRQWLADSELDKEFRNATESERKMLRYELGTIGRRIRGLQQLIENKDRSAGTDRAAPRK
jgi:hypothetical protein